MTSYKPPEPPDTPPVGQEETRTDYRDLVFALRTCFPEASTLNAAADAIEELLADAERARGLLREWLTVDVGLVPRLTERTRIALYACPDCGSLNEWHDMSKPHKSGPTPSAPAPPPPARG